MTARNESLRELCHYTPCFVDYPHECVMWQGCEAMHCDSSVWGRGMGHKSVDMCAAACHNAHQAMTANPDLERDVKLYAFFRAASKTLDFWIEHGWLTPNVKKAKREGTVPA